MASKNNINSRLYEIANQYCRALQRHIGNKLVTVGLFGSVARNEATPFSDIDLLLIIEGLPRGRFAGWTCWKPSMVKLTPI